MNQLRPLRAIALVLWGMFMGFLISNQSYRKVLSTEHDQSKIQEFTSKGVQLTLEHYYSDLEMKHKIEQLSRDKPSTQPTAYAPDGSTSRLFKWKGGTYEGLIGYSDCQYIRLREPNKDQLDKLNKYVSCSPDNVNWSDVAVLLK